MAQQISSNSAAYCTAAQFTTLEDWRTYAQLCVDNDVPPQSQASFQASTILSACLQAGAGRIEMACTIGQRYQPVDLVALITPDPITLLICNSGWVLIRLNASLAAYEMYDRRSAPIPDEIKVKVDRAEAELQALSEGTLIFGLLQTQQAGVMHDYQENAYDVLARRMPSDIARPVFGCRSNMYPPWNSGG